MSRHRQIAAVGSLVLAAAISVQAQRSMPPISADVVTYHKLADGRVLHVDGHYYRSQDGRVREDSGNGAVIVDTKSHTVTILNFETKEAHVMKVPAEKPTPAGREKKEVSGRGNVEGHRVNKIVSTGSRGEEQEVWTADDLGLTVFTRSQSTNMTMTKYVRNIVVHEPSSSLFEIPRDYATRRVDTPSPGQPQAPMLPPAKGGPRRGGGR